MFDIIPRVLFVSLLWRHNFMKGWSSIQYDQSQTAIIWGSENFGDESPPSLVVVCLFVCCLFVCLQSLVVVCLFVCFRYYLIAIYLHKVSISSRNFGMFKSQETTKFLKTVSNQNNDPTMHLPACQLCFYTV